MRFLAIMTIALMAIGCAGSGGAKPAYRETMGELSREIGKLPSSEEKAQIKKLLAKLESQVDYALASRRDDTERLSKLTDFAAAAAPAKIDLGFATSGKDWSGDGVFDGVEVYIVPRDEAGNAVKCPGTAQVALTEESLVGPFNVGRETDRWTVTSETLKGAWNESLFPGYIVQLPWYEKNPEKQYGILNVTFTPLYGAPMSASKRIEINAE